VDYPCDKLGRFGSVVQTNRQTRMNAVLPRLVDVSNEQNNTLRLATKLSFDHMT